MWKAGLAVIGALAASPVFAQFTTGDALVISNAQYGEVSGAFGPAEVTKVASALRLRGQEVEALVNGTADPMADAVSMFKASIGDDESPLIVVLSGVFAGGENGVTLLPAGRAQTPQTDGLALASVLDVLATSPRRAFLVLGEVAAPEGVDAAALDGLDVPKGVTVIRGSAAKVAEFAAREMAQPGQPLEQTAQRYDLDLSGYVSESLIVLEHTEVRPPSEDEQAKALARLQQQDDTAWQTAVAADSAVAYQAYLDSHPEGQKAEAAAERLKSATELDVATRKAVQSDLTQLGYNTRGIDGIFGPATREAIVSWQTKIGADATGALDADQIARLSEDAKAAATAAAAAQARAQANTVRAAVTREPQPAAPAISARERALWNAARGEAGLRTYLSQFPRGAFADRARILISNIQRGARP